MGASLPGRAGGPAIRLSGASVAHGGATLWEGLTLDVAPGEFLAVLGPNGVGKTTLLKVLLGLQPLSSGSVLVAGRPPRRGNPGIGYVPQQRAFDPDLPIRGRDLVGFGLDGHRFGLPVRRRSLGQRLEEAIASVGASGFADAPVGTLSGGEQQRLRIAQALLGDPAILLCDEPLLSLDLSQQRAVTGLIERQRRESGTTVVFVTHEINPVQPFVDRVLYLVGGRWSAGRPEEVLTAARLSELYGTEVEVVRVRGRTVVVGLEEAGLAEPAGHHHHFPGPEPAPGEVRRWRDGGRSR
jgi:zinc/manganese transport system ATP-binding protein